MMMMGKIERIFFILSSYSLLNVLIENICLLVDFLMAYNEREDIKYRWKRESRVDHLCWKK